MRSKEKHLHSGEISIISSKEEKETENREYDIYVDVGEAMVKTSVSNDLNFAPPKKSFQLCYMKEGNEVEKAGRQEAEELVEKKNQERYMVLVDNEESTEAKSLRDAGFTVRRRETSPMRG